MDTWNEDSLTYEQKLEFLRQLCTTNISEEQKLTVLDILAESGWSEIVERKRIILRQLSEMSEEQKLATLDTLAQSGWAALFILPFAQTFPINCQLPKNEHHLDDTKEYRCTGTITHTYCRHHQLKKCPQDGTDLYRIP